MNAVEIKNLTKKFGTDIALDNISLEIKKGGITGLMGADGSGKTTLIRIVTGLLLPESGEITVLGAKPGNIKEKIGYMPQKFGLYEDLTVIENLKLYADLKNHPWEFEKLLDFTGLKNFQNRLAGALSGGMKQKLGLACTILKTPEFLILDEPSVGVDPISRRELMKMVKDLINEDTTVLWSTAYLDEAYRFNRTLILDKGKIIYDGAPKQIANSNKEFENTVINLMGGYKKTESAIARGYKPPVNNVEIMVAAKNLEKKYGNFYAVKNNSFEIKKGEIFGLLGPNGAGKSTSFKMMCGLTRPSRGTAEIAGIDILKNPERARSSLGYMAQKFSLYGSLTLKENLEFFASVYGIAICERKERIDEIIDIFDFKKVYNMKAQSLPLGFKQRLSMACALIHNPPVLFLDEPTSGVDVLTRRDFWNHITSLSKKGVTVLITTHFMDEAEFCDRMSLFYRGEAIAIGTPDYLKERAGADNMEETFVKLIKEFDNK